MPRLYAAAAVPEVYLDHFDIRGQRLPQQLAPIAISVGYPDYWASAVHLDFVCRERRRGFGASSFNCCCRRL